MYRLASTQNISRANRNRRIARGLIEYDGSLGLDQRLEETEIKLINTRKFLDQIDESQRESRAPIKALAEELEWQKKRLLGLKRQQERESGSKETNPEH